MTNRLFPWLCFSLVLLFVSSFCSAQIKDQSLKKDPATYKDITPPDTTTALISRIQATPPDILKKFHDAGMSPREHELTKEERLEVNAAFAMLPPLHQQVLKKHLRGISFLDDMPNTALTAVINPDQPVRLYHITFRAAILKQNVSEWLTEKERTCFDPKDSSRSVAVQAGKLSAILYVLLHEATHVVDGSLGLLKNPDKGDVIVDDSFYGNFTNGIWTDMTTFAFIPGDSLFARNHFRRGGQLFPLSEAAELYKGLKMTPFVSLYSSSSRHEDLAEYLTVYHFTQKLKQPFDIVVSENGKQQMVYKPMASDLVKKRARFMSFFYQKIKNVS